MKRWHWFSVALLAVLLVAALLAVPRFHGGTERAQAIGASLSLQLDMDLTTGTPCNPIDAAGPTRLVGDPSYKIAVCLVDSASGITGQPAAFNFDVVYNDRLNQCVPSTDCQIEGSSDSLCKDSNPDANAGLTTFPSAATSLGPGYDCTAGGTAPPSCDVDSATGALHGRARLSCTSTSTALTLPTGTGVKSPIAEVTFLRIAGGDDSLTLENVSLTNHALTQFLVCPGGLLGVCVGGTDHKEGTPPAILQATPTPTQTPTVGPTPTPSCGRAGSGLPACTPTAKAFTATPTPEPTETAAPEAAPSGGGGGGGENLPPPPPPAGGTGPVVSPPSTGDGSSGVSWATRLIWLMAGLGAISLVSGGLYFRHARMRK